MSVVEMLDIGWEGVSNFLLLKLSKGEIRVANFIPHCKWGELRLFPAEIHPTHMKQIKILGLLNLLQTGLVFNEIATSCFTVLTRDKQEAKHNLQQS